MHNNGEEHVLERLAIGNIKQKRNENDTSECYF